MKKWSWVWGIVWETDLSGMKKRAFGKTPKALELLN
jgi:hypothetical protein